MSFGPWYLSIEKQKGVERYTIRRAVYSGGKQKIERLPVSKYKLIREDKAELDKFVERLNAKREEEIKRDQAIKFKHAFIDQALVDEFQELLLAQIPTRDRALTKMSYLKNHFLNFFIGKQNLIDPLDWYKVQQTSWAKYLKGPLAPQAASTKKEVIQIANRFMKWLHERRPTEVPLLVFKPLSHSVLKELEAKRIMAGDVIERKIINEQDWKIISKSLSENIKPFAMLSYYYGLRRAETLGLKLKDVKKTHLSIERQLEILSPEPIFRPVKGREPRKTPHWFCTPAVAYKLIEQIDKHLMHPDTLTERWNELMGSLKMDYDFHDLRHTWATMAVKKHPIIEVQLAAGHKDIKTTMGYIHDDRGFDDETWSPDDAA